MQLIILALRDLGFSTTKYNVKVGQLKANNNKAMCHLSLKLSDMFDQNPRCTFDKNMVKTHSNKNAVTAF